MKEPADKRVDSASSVIKASPQAIYQAYMDPEKLANWLPPKGMKARIDVFEPRKGGAYEMTLFYEEAGHHGKSSDNADVVHGRFVELVPDRRIVQEVEFDSPDPAFAGTMTMTWELRPVPGGTEVEVRAENVPPGISQEDHLAGIRSTLENLAAFVE
jgi:uncharacterized protein YndB with AHSA1/START domain